MADEVNPGTVCRERRVGCSMALATSALAFYTIAAVAAGAATAPRHSVSMHRSPGLGKVLTTRDGGQIFGFDIDQNGDDGVLSSADLNQQVVPTSVETFDQNTGKITKSFRKRLGEQYGTVVDGIVSGDVGLITHYIPKGEFASKRKYAVMNPVTAQKFTGEWTPPIGDVDVQQVAENQATSTSVLFAIELRKQDAPVLFASDVAANTFSKVIEPNPSLFSLCNGPRLGQFTAGNQAVLASSPDCGARGGRPPITALFDLSSGKVTQFDGYNNGFSHAGSVNGLAVDPNTGVAVTTTELNAQVEFYDLKKKAGITFVQLPCTGDQDQFNSGTSITNDPVSKLFLVTELHYCDGSQGVAIVVYDELGNLVETITGFNPDIGFAVIQPPPRINPTNRMGWAFGGPQSSGEQGVNQLQQFFY
jgi:hypothetical protein